MTPAPARRHPASTPRPGRAPPAAARPPPASTRAAASRHRPTPPPPPRFSAAVAAAAVAATAVASAAASAAAVASATLAAAAVAATARTAAAVAAATIASTAVLPPPSPPPSGPPPTPPPPSPPAPSPPPSPPPAPPAAPPAELGTVHVVVKLGSYDDIGRYRVGGPITDAAEEALRLTFAAAFPNATVVADLPVPPKRAPSYLRVEVYTNAVVRITGIDAGRYSRVGEGEVSGVAAAVLKHFAEVVASLPPKIIRDINAAIGPDSQDGPWILSAQILTNDEERFPHRPW